MTKINQHIEIAHTANMNINTMGLKSCRMIQSALSSVYSKVGISRVNNTKELISLVSKKPDLVFLGLKRLPQIDGFSDIGVEDSWIADYLDNVGINYTGSSRKAHELGVYKHDAKLCVHNAGLPTAKFFKALPGKYKNASELPLGFPLFVKPNSSGGSKGIDDDSVVRNFTEFKKKVEYIYDRFGTSSLVEQYLTGREFSVAVLAELSGGLKAMPIEIIADQNSKGDRILSCGIKKADTERVVTIKETDVYQQVSQLALDVFTALGARDFGRVDIRMDESGQPYFLEANLIPGLSGGYFTRACRLSAGMEYDEMIQHIAKLGLSRSTSAEPLLVDMQFIDSESIIDSVELETNPY